MSPLNSGLNEYAQACEYLATVLAGITGSKGVWEHPAPQTAELPYVTFQSAGNSDLAEIGEQRIWAEITMQVMAWGKGASTMALKPIADEIDKRLQDTAGSTTEAYILSVTRIQTLSVPEVDAGIAYRRLGGMYRLLVQKKGV